MANEIILHVGPHKTGSTALQHAFERHADRLDAAGVRYAVSGRADRAHHGLVQAVRRQPTIFDAEALAREAETVPRMLLSSENVVHVVEPLMRQIAASLPVGEVRIVYYLRRLVDLWPSYWQELVKHGSPNTFAHYLASAGFTITTARNAQVDQFQQLTTLREVFGEEAINIVGYDHLRATKMDIYTHFVREVLGLDDVETDAETGSINTSQPFWLTELLRLLNLIHRETTGQETRGALRIDAMEAIDAGEVPFIDEFRTLAEARSRDVVIRGNATFAAQQRTLIRREFAGSVVGDADAVFAAHGSAKDRRVRTFVFPRTGEEALFARIVAFYRALRPDPAPVADEPVAKESVAVGSTGAASAATPGTAADAKPAKRSADAASAATR